MLANGKVARTEIGKGESMPVEQAKVKEGADIAMTQNGNDELGWEDAEDAQIRTGCGWRGKRAGGRRNDGF